jgi:hypothetical protein
MNADPTVLLKAVIVACGGVVRLERDALAGIDPNSLAVVLEWLDDDTALLKAESANEIDLEEE